MATQESITPKLSEIKYSLEIDEEGYPIFSGLRIHDEEVLKDIFQNLQRVQPDLPKSKIVTCLEGHKWAWIDSFDAPLIVQDVEFATDKSSDQISDPTGDPRVELHFLGDLSFEVALKDLSTDEWDRLHCYVGEQQFPAVFSRKAQARFLNEWMDHSESKKIDLTLHRFRDPALEREKKESVSSSSTWDKAYQAQDMGWDLGEAHPQLKQSLEDLKQCFQGKNSLWVPGAGRGHDAVFFARETPMNVHAFDFSPEAVSEFSKAYPDFQSNPEKRLKYECVDMFNILKATPDASVDALFEHTFFCAISPIQRAEYVAEIKRVLKPTGLWFGVYFLLEHKGGAPFSLTQWELREWVQKSFNIKAWERIKESPKTRAHKELWAVFEKI